MTTPKFHLTESFARLACLVGLGAGVAWVTGCYHPRATTPAPAAVRPSATARALAQYHQEIEPILQAQCYDCHGNGESRAEVAFDTLRTDDQILHNPQLWLKVLQNTRSGLMPPPPKHGRLSAAAQQALDHWIEVSAFGVDPANLDPGRLTVRRLNRTEYRNTIRDLMGVDYDTDIAFPADDVGYGFDVIGDVQNLSPMRMEKYLEAARFVVAKSVPVTPRALAEQFAIGKDFLTADGKFNGDPMSFYVEKTVAHTFQAPLPGDYRVIISTMVDGLAKPDPQKCTISVKDNGREFFTNLYVWYDCEFYTDERVLHLDKGAHEMSFSLRPVLDLKQTTKMDYKILTVQVQGPLDPKDWTHPPGYDRFFTRDLPPEDAAGRRAYAKEVLGNFATKAFRRPPSPDTLDQLVDLAEETYKVPGNTFEAGVAHGMVAALASPRFLFRTERTEPAQPGQPFANLDEYALASRLSYFLWSSMPDAELFQLAQAGKLRQNLEAQVKRMFADPRAKAFVENFAGQWLQSRDVMNLSINRPVVMALEGVTTRDQLTPAQRTAMKEEAEDCFGYVAHQDRSVLELLDSDYTFLNETLAKFYGVPNVTGPEMRKVTLPPGDVRGGILTLGSVLEVTSNPTRTSPVKRGKWILENVLGSSIAPPPPMNIPALEVAFTKFPDHAPTQREALALHRQDAQCASCHSRMDPLGLALENFNALGLWRTNEQKQLVDPTGQLVTGESIQNAQDLKRILATNHSEEFYRTLTEKLLTYAVGRGMEYYDEPSVDKIVERLKSEQGRFSALLLGVIESAPFQERRLNAAPPNPGAKLAAQIDPSHEIKSN